jgi:ATP-dependent helicase/DNAse subunit B
MTPPRPFHLSASAISAYKACGTQFGIGYIEGVRPEQDIEPARIGTNWHSMHEMYQDAITAGSEEAPAFHAAIDHLNTRYALVPDGYDTYKWQIERAVLAAGFTAYHAVYANRPLETVATEVAFKLPLHHPYTRMPLRTDEVVRVGKIDRFTRRSANVIAVSDYKTTTRDIAQDGDFWDHLIRDTQISMYVLAASEMAASGELEPYGISKGTDITMCGGVRSTSRVC